MIDSVPCKVLSINECAIGDKSFAPNLDSGVRRCALELQQFINNIYHKQQMQTNLDNIREGNMSQVDIFCYRSSSSLFDDINVPIEKVLSHHYARRSFAIERNIAA